MLYERSVPGAESFDDSFIPSTTAVRRRTTSADPSPTARISMGAMPLQPWRGTSPRPTTGQRGHRSSLAVV